MLAAESRVNLLRYLLFRSGMLTTNGAETGALRTRARAPRAGRRVGVLAGDIPEQGPTPPTQHGYLIAVILLRPASRGYVSLRSGDALDAPIICTNHFSEGRDLPTLVEGIKFARCIAATPPLAAFGGGEIEPGTSAVNDDDLAAAIRSKAQMVWHPAGTCRMGVDSMCIVDPELRVLGVENLRVVDASVMPTIIRGHPNAATIMIAEKAADLLLRRMPSQATCAAAGN